jgi:hypothetical protein
VKARSAIISRSLISLTFSVRSLVFRPHFSACSIYQEEKFDALDEKLKATRQAIMLSLEYLTKKMF